MSTFKGIKPMDRVAFVSERGVVRWGFAQLLGTHVTHVRVVTQHGTECVVNSQNYHSHMGPGALMRGWPVTSEAA